MVKKKLGTGPGFLQYTYNYTSSYSSNKWYFRDILYHETEMKKLIWKSCDEQVTTN